MSIIHPDWKIPEDRRDISGAPVRIWRLRISDLGGSPRDHLRPFVSSREYERADRFAFEQDQLHHLAGRALARVLLLPHYGDSPQDVPIEEGDDGKPFLAAPADTTNTVEFNLAHADGVVLAAMSQSWPVGIDVEPVDRLDQTAPLAERILSRRERRNWQTIPHGQRPGFLIQVWTCKEAFLKGTGTGLRRSLDSIECVADGTTITGITDAEERNEGVEPVANEWKLQCFRVSQGMTGAVARHHRLPSELIFADARALFSHSKSQ